MSGSIGKTRSEVAVAAPQTPKPTQDVAAPNWVAVAALILSVLTLLKTFYADYRTIRRNTRDEFERHIGGAVRSGLREFDQRLKTLRSFCLTNPADIADQILDAGNNLPNWLSAMYDLGRLLDEVDERNDLISPGWAIRFKVHSDRAEVAMIAMTEASVKTAEELRILANEAYDTLKCGIAEVRTSLRQQERSYRGILDQLWHG